MNRHLPFVLCIAFFLACSNDPPTAPNPIENLLTIESATKELKEGQCDDGNYESKCANISLRYPIIKNGNDTLTAAVSDWAEQFMVSMLDPGLEDGQTIPLDSAIQSFLEMHREMTQEMPDLPGYYTVEVTDTILLKNDKYITLRLDAYTYTGGAHPNAFSAIATFDIASGRLLTANDFVNDLEKLEVIAEEKFRHVQSESFAEGFEFDTGWPFKLADNIGLINEGLLFCYIPYEVGPYALGFTEFVIPFSELASIKNTSL